MPTNSLIKKALVVGYITSIPNRTSTRSQFQFLAERLNGQPVRANLLLSCYRDCPKLQAGQHWQLYATLKKPLNLANPGGFDYVGWLSSRHLQWVGNVSHFVFNVSAPPRTISLLTLREQWDATLVKLISDEKLVGIFEALTIGLTHHIDKSQWDLFRRTGTTHLIDISGEHIALIAGLSYVVFKWVWKRLGSVCLLYPAPKMASAAAMVISLLYALIAGFSVPTQRAVATGCFMLLHHFCHHRLTIWQAWRYALLVVLLFEPHSVYMIGFYFSFVAVAILILINQRMPVKGWRKMLCMQLACLFGIMPLSLYWFSYGSVIGLVANLLAIPFVGFIIVPLALVVAFLSPWFIIPGSVAILKWSIGLLLWALTALDSLSFFNFNFTFTEALPALSMMAVMCIFLFLPLKRFNLTTSILLLACFFPHPEKIPEGTVRMDILDVGQGLAIAIRTAKHVLIYDTGMKFYQSNDMGQLAIIPYLNKVGVKQIDYIIVSHPDLDHRGGLGSLMKTYPVKKLIVDDPPFYKQGLSCHTFPAWHWNGVSFRFFPLLHLLPGKNNHSCVLQIATAAGQILLTGDIEKKAEEDLVKTYKEDIRSSVLLVPHHGSKTSSSKLFVQQVAPSYALLSFGFNNRYHLPHAKTLKTYKDSHIPLYDTVKCGMIRVELTPDAVLEPTCFR